MIIPKEDYSSVNNINQQTNTQHNSKNYPWQEQVMISLQIKENKIYFQTANDFIFRLTFKAPTINNIDNRIVIHKLTTRIILTTDGERKSSRI